MTNIQAIDLLKGLEQSLDDYCELNDEGKAAFRMAIEALELFGNAEQLPSAQPDVPDTNVRDRAVTESDLIDWYINSVDESEPVWTEEHIYELFNDFYLIPKENR